MKWPGEINEWIAVPCVIVPFFLLHSDRDVNLFSLSDFDRDVFDTFCFSWLRLGSLETETEAGQGAMMSSWSQTLLLEQSLFCLADFLDDRQNLWTELWSVVETGAVADEPLQCVSKVWHKTSSEVLQLRLKMVDNILYQTMAAFSWFRAMCASFFAIHLQTLVRNTTL